MDANTPELPDFLKYFFGQSNFAEFREKSGKCPILA
jgi:hypothetical protein